VIGLCQAGGERFGQAFPSCIQPGVLSWWLLQGGEIFIQILAGWCSVAD